MPIDTTVLDADLDAVIADLPATMVWHGQDISVAGSGLEQTEDLEMAGIFANRDVEVIAPVASFTGTPAVGDTVTIYGITARINRISRSADQIQYLINLVRETG